MRPQARLAAFALLWWLPALAATAQTPRPLPPPPAMFTFTATPPPLAEDPLIVLAIKQEFARMQLGRVDRTLYSRELNQVLTPDKVASFSKQLAPLGDAIRFAWRSTFAQGPDIGYQYAITCNHGSVLMTYVISAEGKEDGVLFNPL
jgi:hypothetical protein